MRNFFEGLKIMKLATKAGVNFYSIIYEIRYFLQIKKGGGQGAQKTTKNFINGKSPKHNGNV